MSTWAGLALVIAISLAASFLFSGIEAGLPLVNRLRVRNLMRQGHAAARALHGLLEAPEEFLWTILVGNTLTTFALMGTTLYLLHEWLRASRWVLLAVLAAVAFLIYAFADLLPKMLFQQFPNRLCLALARPFRLIHLMLRPLVAPVSWLAGTLLWATGGRRFTGRLFGTREELRLVMQESAQALTSDELAMVNRVLDLQTLTVGVVMVPLARVTSVPADAPVREFFRLCRETGRDRLPVRASNGSRIVGLVTLHHTLYDATLDGSEPVERVLQPAAFFEHEVTLEAALQRLQRSGQRLAVVLDEHRREVGIVTLTDILRFIFGEVVR